MTFFYKGFVASDLEDTKIFIENILDRVREVFIDEDLLFDLKIILNELIINSVIHGNKCDINKTIMLSLEIVDNIITIEVCDEGKGIDYELLGLEEDDLSSCGRGLLIVDGLSDELYVNKNRIVAKKHI